MTADSARGPSRGGPVLRGIVLCLLLAAFGAAWFGQHHLQYGVPPATGAALLLGAVGVLTAIQVRFHLGAPEPAGPDGRAAYAPETPGTRAELWAVAGIVAMGIAFRVVHFFTIPDGMNHDAAWYGMYTLEIGRGVPYTPYVSAAWGRETLFMYIASLFLPLWGNSPELMQFASTVVGILTFVPMYLFARAVLGPRLALVALAFFVVSGWHNVFSRAGWRVITVPPAFALMLWAFWRTHQSQRRRYWVLMGVGCGLAINTYNAGRIAPIMLAALGVALLDWRRWKQSLAGSLLALAAFLIVGGPMLWYAYHNYGKWQARAESFAEQPQPAPRGVDSWRDAALLFNYRGNGNDFFINEPLLEPAAGALFLLGVVTSLRFIRRRDSVLLLLGLALAVVPGVFSVPNGNRCITAMPFVFVLIARGVGSLAGSCTALVSGTQRQHWIGPAVLALPALIAAVESYDEFLGPHRRPILGFNPAATAAGEFMKPYTNRYKTYVIAAGWPEYTMTFLGYDGKDSPLERDYVPVDRWANAEQDIDRLGSKALLFMLDLGPAGTEGLGRLREMFPAHRLEDVRARRMGHRVVARAFIVEVDGLTTGGAWDNRSNTLLVRARTGSGATAGGIRCFDAITEDEGFSARVQLMLPEVGDPLRVGEVRWLAVCPPRSGDTPVLRVSIQPSGLTVGADEPRVAIPWPQLEAGRWYEVTALASTKDRTTQAWIDDRPLGPLPERDGSKPTVRVAGVQVVGEHADVPAGHIFLDQLSALGGLVPRGDERWTWSAEQHRAFQANRPGRGPLAFMETFEQATPGPLSPADGWRDVQGISAVGKAPTVWRRTAGGPDDGVNAFDGWPGSGPGAFQEPMGVAIDPSGNFFVSERLNHRVQKFAPDGTPVARWGEFGDRPGMFREPHDLAADDQFLYVADTWNNRVQVFDWNGMFVSEIKGPPALQTPRGIFARDGKVYVADSGHGVIQVFEPSGKHLLTMGQPHDSEPGHLIEPIDVVADATGRVFATNPGNNRIEIFDPGGLVTGAFPIAGWEGTGMKESYLFIDDTDMIYLSDWQSNRVRRFTPNGTELHPVGPRLDRPSGLAGRHGRLLVAGRGQARIAVAPLY